MFKPFEPKIMADDKRPRLGLRFTVKNIFKSSKTHTGPAPANESQWGSSADQPDVLTTLHEAVRNDNLAMVNRVLKAFPHELYETDDQGMTPLCLCILHNNLAMAKRLYAAGASPLPSRNNSESVMCFAALAQNPDIVRWLASLNFRTLLDARDPAGNTPLHHAVLRTNPLVTAALLKAGADPNIQALRTTPLPDAAPDAPLPGIGSPLFYALDKSLNSAMDMPTRVEHVKMLLQAGARLDVLQEVDGTYAVHEAAMSGEVELVRELFEHADASPSPNGDEKEGKGLLDVNARTTTPRDEAMRGSTPLMYACGRGVAAVVRLLVDRGADVRAVNHTGETALHWAGANENEDEVEGGEVVRMIVKEGVDVNVRNRLGGTALHIAAYRGRLGNVKVLLELGVDTRVVTTDLHFEKMIGVKGTAEEIARGEGHWEVAECIKEWEATHPMGGWKASEGAAEVAGAS